MQDSLPSKYSPKDIEKKWYSTWESSNFFQPSNIGKPYCIVIPPPNVTGSLHMGHGFQHTIMDALTRYHRMCGFKTLWQPGTDHAGIATQMIVEKKLLQQGIHKEDLGREKFIDKVWDWKNHSGDNISKQIRRLGASLDWSRDKFTLDHDMSETVEDIFIQLYKENLIYRGTKLVNWDPVLGTAISDLEVKNEEEKGKIWEIKYPFVDSDLGITVATTRPETLFGDVAIAIHPDDDRYKKYIGKEVLLPLTNRKIPIIADNKIDKEFGTGCVKITPAHDFNDYEIGLSHNLAPINILTKEAKLNSVVPKNLQGLDCQTARKLVVQDLENQGLLIKSSDHIHMIPRGDRSGAIIEPLLTEQWFVK
ncbi:MAG: class I tRNA ligase family protein, partial [Legionellales bacterium]|nr:class I tRNA ligase family protein [Legionellales bacterium]